MFFGFKGTDKLSFRVNTIVTSHIEAKGEAWLAAMGYAESNDYALSVTQLVSFASHNEHIRFETVARYIRQQKSAIRKKLVAEGVKF